MILFLSLLIIIAVIIVLAVNATFKSESINRKENTIQQIKGGYFMVELTELKDRLEKITKLLEKLDERLALGEISEPQYKQLSDKYKAEAENLKSQITEKELLQDVGLEGEKAKKPEIMYEQRRGKEEEKSEERGEEKKGAGIFWIGVLVGFIAMIVLSFIPILGPILAGLIAGIIAGGGAGRGAKAGFLSGIIGPLVAFGLLGIGGSMLGGWLGGLIGGAIGIVLIIISLIYAILGIIGGAIGGLIRK